MSRIVTLLPNGYMIHQGGDIHVYAKFTKQDGVMKKVKDSKQDPAFCLDIQSNTKAVARFKSGTRSQGQVYNNSTSNATTGDRFYEFDHMNTSGPNITLNVLLSNEEPGEPDITTKDKIKDPKIPSPHSLYRVLNNENTGYGLPANISDSFQVKGSVDIDMDDLLKWRYITPYFYCDANEKSGGCSFYRNRGYDNIVVVDDARGGNRIGCNLQAFTKRNKLLDKDDDEELGIKTCFEIWANPPSPVISNQKAEYFSLSCTHSPDAAASPGNGNPITSVSWTVKNPSGGVVASGSSSPSNGVFSGSHNISATGLTEGTAYTVTVSYKNARSTQTKTVTITTPYAPPKIKITGYEQHMSYEIVKWQADVTDAGNIKPIRYVDWKCTGPTRTNSNDTWTGRGDFGDGSTMSGTITIYGTLESSNYSVAFTSIQTTTTYGSRTTENAASGTFRTQDPPTLTPKHYIFGENLIVSVTRICTEATLVRAYVNNNKSGYYVVSANTEIATKDYTLDSTGDQNRIDAWYKLYPFTPGALSNTIPIVFELECDMYNKDATTYKKIFAATTVNLQLTGIMKTVRAGLPVNDPIQKDPIPTRRCMVWLGDANGTPHRCVTWINPTDTKGDANTHRTI